MKKINFELLSIFFVFILSACKFGYKNEVSYKVLHMQQNIEDDGYTIVEEESFSGTIGTKINIQTKAYEGFEIKPLNEQVVKDNLSVPVYYDRKLVTFDFNLAGGTGETSITKKYGTPVTKEIIPDPVNGTSRFSCWIPSLPEIFTEDLTFTANWNYSSYKVKFMFQNPEGDDYSPDTGAISPEEIFYGSSGTETAYEPPVIQGFELNRVEQAILGDEEQTVTVYYDRSIVTVCVNLNGGTGNSIIKGRMGAPFTESLLGPFIKQGYVLEGYDKSLPETFNLEDNNKTILSVLWRGEGQARYSVRFYYENLDWTYTENKDYAVTAIGEVEGDTDIQVDGDYFLIAGNRYAVQEGWHPAEGNYARKIVGNETTVVNVQCDRNISKMILDLKGGNVNGKTEPVEYSGRYGDKIIIPEELNPKKLGYTFTYYYLNGHMEWPKQSKTLEGYARYTANSYVLRINSNCDDDIPAVKEYIDFTTRVKNDEDFTFTRTSYQIAKPFAGMSNYYATLQSLMKPLHVCTGLSKTKDGEVLEQPVEDTYYNQVYEVYEITIPKETVEEDGQIINYYLQWEPVTIGKADYIGQPYPNNPSNINKTVKLTEDGILSFKVHAYDGTGATYVKSDKVKPDLLFYIGDRLLATENNVSFNSINCTEKLFSYNLKELGFTYGSSEAVPLSVQLRYNVSTIPDKPNYLYGEKADFEFYTPLTEKATNLRIISQDGGKIKCSWTNPKAQDTFAKVRFGAMKYNPYGYYEKSDDGYYKNYIGSGWYKNASDATNGECDSEAEVTAEIVTNSSDYLVCYVEVTDIHGYVSCSEFIRAFPFYYNNRAGGQFFYEDGTFSNDLIAGKTPIGISLGTKSSYTMIMGLKAKESASFCTKEVYATKKDTIENIIRDNNLDVNDFEALKYCLDYREGGYDDWILLPDDSVFNGGVQDSLRILRENGIECPSFEAGKYYWTSNIVPYNGDSKYHVLSCEEKWEVSITLSGELSSGNVVNTIGVIPVRKILNSQ